MFSSQETNALLQTAAAYVEDNDGGYDPEVQTPFFLNRDRQRFLLPNIMIDDDDEVPDEDGGSSSTPTEDGEDDDA